MVHGVEVLVVGQGLEALCGGGEAERAQHHNTNERAEHLDAGPAERRLQTGVGLLPELEERLMVLKLFELLFPRSRGSFILKISMCPSFSIISLANGAALRQSAYRVSPAPGFSIPSLVSG